MNTLEKEIDEIFGSRVVMAIFERMEIVDNELTKLKKDYPDKQEIVHDCFMASNTVIRPVCEPLIGLHVKLQVERMIAEQFEELQEPTDAEVLWVLSEMSLRAPLTIDCTTAYQKLFAKHFGRDMMGGDIPREIYMGKSEEIHETVKKKYKKEFDSLLKSRAEKYLEGE